MQKSKCGEVVKNSAWCNVWHIIGAQEGLVAAHLIITISPTGKASASGVRALPLVCSCRASRRKVTEALRGQPLRGCLLSSFSLEGPDLWSQWGPGEGVGPSWPLQLAAAVTVGWSWWAG